MENEIKYIDESAIGPYIQKCLSELNNKDTNWLGAEVYRRVNSGDEAKGQMLATWHQKAKQWVKGDHTPSMEILFALSGIFGKSINELMAGKDLPDFGGAHLSLYSVAKSNSPALYEQLCSFKVDGQADEYGKSLLNYVLEFKSDKVLLAMLNNRLNPIELFDYYAVDPVTTISIPLGRFLLTALKSRELFIKLYSPLIPWTFSKEPESDSVQPVIWVDSNDMAMLLKQKWCRDLLLKDYEQKGCAWIDKVNRCHVTGLYSDRPYLHGAFNCALEESLRSGDPTFAWFGLSHNQKLVKFLTDNKVLLNELMIDRYGRVVDNGRPVATLAYLSSEVSTSLAQSDSMVDILNELVATYASLNN